MLSTKYNALVAAIAAWRPNELADHSVLARHLKHPPAFFLSSFNASPEAVASLAPACVITFTPSNVPNPRLFAAGFFWPVAPDPSGLANEKDYELKITTGTPYDHSYMGDKYPQTVYGYVSAPFGPHGPGPLPVLRYGGGKVMMTTHVIKNFNLAHTKVALFAPRMRGQALLVVWAEDNG
jgi:hypothetical protein